MQKPTNHFYYFLALFFLGAFFASAQAAVNVDKVDFNSLNDDWIQMAVELSCDGNSNPEARDADYVEDIGVKVYLAYKSEEEGSPFDYYISEVEIVIMKKGEDQNVYFYLPGFIVERDSLPDDPEFYYVEISIGGEVVQPKERTPAMSRTITDLNILNKFVTNANDKGAVNESILAPIYLVYGIDLGRVSDLPAFRRSEVRD